MSYMNILLLIMAVQTTPAIVETATPTIIETVIPAVVETVVPEMKDGEKTAFSLKDPQGLPGLKADHYVHDFGTAYLSRTMDHEFQIQNTGETPVEITDIKADCGCTIVDMETRFIEAGTSAPLTVTFTPEFQVGRIDKKITVYTDLPGKRNWLELSIRADIATVITIDPVNVYFKNVHFGEASIEEVHITAKKGSGVIITAVEQVEGRLDMELIPVTGESKDDTGPREWTLRLTLPEDTPAGKFVSKIRVLTNSTDQPEAMIQAIGFVRSQISILPTQCYLGTLKPGDEVVKTFRIRKIGDPTLEAPTVRTKLPGLTWSVETAEEGSRYNLEVRVAIPEDHTGRLSGDFTILTNDPTRPEFTVPVFGYTPKQ